MPRRCPGSQPSWTQPRGDGLLLEPTGRDTRFRHSHLRAGSRYCHTVYHIPAAPLQQNNPYWNNIPSFILEVNRTSGCALIVRSVRCKGEKMPSSEFLVVLWIGASQPALQCRFRDVFVYSSLVTIARAGFPASLLSYSGHLWNTGPFFCDSRARLSLSGRVLPGFGCEQWYFLPDRGVLLNSGEERVPVHNSTWSCWIIAFVFTPKHVWAAIYSKSFPLDPNGCSSMCPHRTASCSSEKRVKW